MLLELSGERAAQRACAEEKRRQPLSFEEQLARVEAGAAVVEKFQYHRPAPDMTLGGIATAAL
jgi:hypothetical protein